MSGLTFTLLLLGFGSLWLVIGLFAARRIHDRQDYFLAGRQLNLWVVALTLAATQVGGGLILGTSDTAFQIGLFSMVYPLGQFLGFALLASGFASRLRGFRVSTTAELFEVKYHSPLLRKIASLMIVIAMGGLLVGQIVAARKFMYGLGMDNEWVFLIFWAFVIVYTMIGGLKAVAWTDVYQVLFILGLFIVLFIVTLTQFPVHELNWQPQPQALAKLEFHLLTPLLLPVLFCIVEQDLAQRCFAARSKRAATLGALVAAIILLTFGFVPVYFGVLAEQLGIQAEGGQSILVVLLAQLYQPWVLALLTVGLLAAIISTADSLLCAISSNLALDFNLHRLSDKAALTWSRVITLLGGIVALLIAYRFDNILLVLIHSAELPVSALFIPILMCCLKQRVHRLGAVLAVVFGTTAFVWFKLFPVGYPNEVVQIGVSFIGYCTGVYYKRITHYKLKSYG
jgi:SSS family solute:Na+ symporter